MTNYEKLIAVLQEVFMLDKAELDFGIYRIMNQKRTEIEQFLHKDLLPQVKQVLAQHISSDKQNVQRELEEALKQAHALGADPDTLPKVKILKEQLERAADVTALENEIFSHVANFFKRYFDNGDFISQRRYKKDVYSIPYEGEEVKLHWANYDQYYIKTSEYFKNYRFKISENKYAAFELVSASTEQNNNKIVEGKERRFALYEEKPVEAKDGVLTIYFTYEPVDKKIKREELLQKAFDLVKNKIPADFLEVLKPVPTEKDKTRTLLQKHFNDYTARNTFDYFIHKDLGGFLRRELDFYIKNEVLFIDDINTKNEQKFIQQLSQLKAIKTIAEKIIAFLAQLEDFQKKLWLKKKFVVETNYCITLDRIPKELYASIANNEQQTEEWVRLFAISEIKESKANEMFEETKVGFTRPLKVEFLEQNPYLVLDTAFFNDEFKLKLLQNFDRLDEQTDGLLINSENFQALRLLQERYKNIVSCTYIDPPFNTGEDDFPYKDNFQHSSWMSMMADRIYQSTQLLSEHGMMCIHIGDDETCNVRLLIESGSLIRKNSVVVRRGIKNVQAQFDDIDKLALGHDYIHVATRQNIRLPHLKQSLKAEKSGKWDTFWRGTDRVTMRYEVFGINPQTGQWRWEPIRAKRAIENYEYYLENESSSKTLDAWYIENLQAGIDLDFVRKNEEGTVQYYVPPQGSKLVSDNWLDVSVSGSFTSFPHEKSVELLTRVISWNTKSNSHILDFFGGSATTAHAVITLNNTDGAKRKYVLVEMGDYFDTITKPRIQKVIYSKDWKDDKPVSREGSSHCFKYIRLESYEDTLNNLTLQRNNEQELALQQNSSFKEGYLLNYMLDVESRDSLLNLQWFINPFNCYLNITRNNETKPTKIDLVETFNYLIGLQVQSYSNPKAGYVTVTGTTLKGEKILVVWRNCELHNSEALNEFLQKSKFNPLDNEFDRIYVNGDNNVENLKLGEEKWKVVMIEEEFKKRMFEAN